MMYLFDLLYFVCFTNVVWSNESESSEFRGVVVIHSEIVKIFNKAMNLELLCNGKSMYNPLDEIADYVIEEDAWVGDLWTFCAERLKKFDEDLWIEPNEVMFTSFYYKMLKWLNYQLSQVQGVKVFNAEVTDVVDGIIARRQISEDIKIAFDRRIYDLKTPSKLALFGEERDRALKLIYSIEARNAEVLRVDPSSEIVDGKMAFNAIVCCHLVVCKKIEIYEYLIRKMGNNENYNNYELSSRKLQLIGLVDITLITFGGGYKRNIDYDIINLNNHTRGTVDHFKHASLLFMRAVEKHVFVFGEEFNHVTYDFQKAFIENFSTRSQAFNLRICSLNVQVQVVVGIFSELYKSWVGHGELKDAKIRLTFYRILKWFSMYANFQACSYTINEINKTYTTITEVTPIEKGILDNVRIPRGISTLKELAEFAVKGGKIEEVSLEENPNDDTNTSVRQEEALEPINDVENTPEEEINTDTYGDVPVIVVDEKPSGWGFLNAMTKNDLLGKTPSLSNLQYWVKTIRSLIVPPLEGIKNAVVDKLKFF